MIMCLQFQIIVEQRLRTNCLILQTAASGRMKSGCLFYYYETQLSGQPKKAQTAPIKLKKADLKLNWQAYAATTGTSQPSAFNFLRYALILRSLLN